MKLGNLFFANLCLAGISRLIYFHFNEFGLKFNFKFNLIFDFD